MVSSPCDVFFPGRAGMGRIPDAPEAYGMFIGDGGENFNDLKEVVVASRAEPERRGGIPRILF